MDAFIIKAKVWLYPGDAAWYFVSIPKKESVKLQKTFEGLQRGFGSLPVTVTVGSTSWKTSIFPNSKDGVFMLPIKAQVRKKENIKAEKIISFKLEVRI